MPSNKKSSAGPLIKGYLPVRLSIDDNDDDETFFYVKQHFSSDNATLFVANVPCVPDISSRVLLMSLFGRFGNVKRVTVIQNPRNKNDETTPTLSPFESKNPSFLPQHDAHGKFAHVVFESPKEMKRVLREVTRIMSQQTGSDGLSLERVEIQTLQDESKRQEKINKRTDNYDDSDDDESNVDEPQQSGILAVAQRYRTSCQALSRDSLLEECNSIMEQYEDEEQAEKRARSSNSSEPDEDGFITVSYSSTNIGSKRDLDQAGGRKRGGSKRSRKKKDPNEGLTDFYRFQTKESRKQGLQDLRKRFEQDLAKVKKMKEDRQYRPF